MRSTGSRGLLLLAVAVALTLTFVGVVWLRGGGELPAPQADPNPTVEAAPKPPGVQDVSDALLVARAPFCDLVEDTAVQSALGGEITDRVAYDNGDRVEVGSFSDVAHEYGCRWEGRKGLTARAWVFVPPVTVKQARSIIKVTRSGTGCRNLPGSYGAPSLGLACAGKSRQQASYRGLFGDAWLTCTLSAPASMKAWKVARRADRWCAAVALAAGDETPSSEE